MKKTKKTSISSSSNSIEDSNIGGWKIIAITEYIEDKPCIHGDAFIEAPDGSRAIICWEKGIGKTITFTKADKKHWGVYKIFVPKSVTSTKDYIENFKFILPELKKLYKKEKKKYPSLG